MLEKRHAVAGDICRCRVAVVLSWKPHMGGLAGMQPLAAYEICISKPASAASETDRHSHVTAQRSHSSLADGPHFFLVLANLSCHLRADGFKAGVALSAA